MLRREQIERLKERYPAGTVVRLGQMEGEHQMPSGMEGKVTGVDDIGQIHVEWENGSTLALNVEEDDFTVVPQKETIAEKKCREFLGKVNEILKEFANCHFLVSTHILEYAKAFEKDSSCCFYYMEAEIKEDCFVCPHRLRKGISEARVGYWLVKKILNL